MGISSTSNTYGVPEGLYFSFPCHRGAGPGTYEVIPELPLTVSTLEKLTRTTEELLLEKTDALACLSK